MTNNKNKQTVSKLSIPKILLYSTISILTAISFLFLIVYVLAEFILVTIWKELFIAFKYTGFGFFKEVKKLYLRIDKI